jgi:Ca2+-binding RTX toxin-like protein
LAIPTQVLTFAPGETAKTIAINLIEDTTTELAEAFNIIFSSESGATFTSHRSHVVISQSDLGQVSSPVITIPNAFALESDGLMEFVVSLSAPSAQSVSVYYQTGDATALTSVYNAENDFSGFNAALVFAAGETLKTVRIPLVDDTTAETTESYTVTFYSPTNATIGSTAIIGTILDNDPTALTTGITVSSINGPNILEGRGTNDSLVGSATDNVLIGKGGADNLSGGDGNDLYLVEETGDVVVEASTTGMDTVLSYLSSYSLPANVENLYLGSGAVNGSGNELNNNLTGNALGNALNGGAGIDTANFHSNLSGYTLTKTGSSYTVRSNTGVDGTDTVTNVEALRFTDKTVNLTIQAKAAAAPQADVQNLAELYVAFFNRVPDADGLSYWIDQKAGGLSLNQIADSFYAAGIVYSEQTGFTTDMTDADFVRLIYKNVLGRSGATSPPDGDVNYWAGNLQSGEATRGSLINIILIAAHEYKGNPDWGWVADLLDNKIAVAKTFAIDWGLNYNTPQDSITQGMAIAAAITPTGTQDAMALIGVSAAEMHLV